MNAILQDIIKMVESSSSFHCDDAKESRYLLFSTREHGMVMDEQHSELDVKEAQRVIKLIKSKYPDLGLQYEIEAVDEWVMIFIRPPKIRQTIYHFMKHQSRHWKRFSAGFSKGFYSIEELIENYGHWDEVKDIDLIKLKDTKIEDQKVRPFGEFNKIVQIYDAGDENKYSYSIGFSLKEDDQTLEEYFDNKGNWNINV